jgi:MFS family permease
MPLLLITLLLLFFSGSPLLCLTGIALLALFSNMTVSILVPAWLDLLAETIPEKKRGRLFGYREGIASTMGLFSGGVCTAILAYYSYPGNFALLYFLAFVSMLISWLIFSKVKEVPQNLPLKHKQKQKAYFRDLVKTFKDDPNYKKYILYKLFSKLGMATFPFYAIVALSIYGFTEAETTALFLIGLSSAKIAGNFLAPFLIEKKGHRWGLQLATSFHIMTALLAALAPSSLYFLGVPILAGLGMACNNVSGMPFLIQISPRGKRVGYSTLSTVALTPVALIAAPLSGFSLQLFGHSILFGLVALLLLLSMIPLQKCQELPKTIDNKNKNNNTNSKRSLL